MNILITLSKAKNKVVSQCAVDVIAWIDRKNAGYMNQRKAIKYRKI